MNQHLFRQFLYVNTSPMLSWLVMRGALIHETGPFTRRNLNSTDLGGHLEFEVGRPWGHTALVTGYSGRHLGFPRLPRDFYTTRARPDRAHRLWPELPVTRRARYV